ncbi:MAG: hypothetical protein MUF15_08860 [Acidobacteria bacterium]|jgi:hypothetical protein|nr:hypothetical protein [Acidobacteriota bacterium]
MQLTKDIYEAHRQLSNCSARFLEFVEKNSSCLDRSGFDTLLSDNRFNYFKSQPWPTFINEKKKKEISEAVLNINDLVKSLISRFFSFDQQKISNYYEIEPNMTKLLLYGVDDNYIKKLLGRGDFIITPSGEFKCLEFNMQANMGGWELDLLEPLYIGTPVIARFLKESNTRVIKNHFFPLLFEHLLDTYLDKHPREGKRGEIAEVNMAITFPGINELDYDETTVRLQNLYKNILLQKNNALKGDFFICGYNSLKLAADFLVYAGRKIHILVEMLNGRTPIIFMEAVKKGNLVICNGPVTQIMSNKLNLALLSEHQDSGIFSPEEQQIIKKYIPWTRKINHCDAAFLLSERERLVLKSAEGLGGQEVFPGRHTSPEEWKQRVEKALEEKRWVVQEYITPSCYLYQHGEIGCTEHHAIWGLFVLGSQYGGGFVRVMPAKNTRGVINTRQGAEESIIIEVEES